ncbi:hypothetical protein D3C86_1070940 [compost metagenome]
MVAGVGQPQQSKAMFAQLIADTAKIRLIFIQIHETQPDLDEQHVLQDTLRAVENRRAVAGVVQHQPIHPFQPADVVQPRGRHRQRGQHRRNVPREGGLVVCRQEFQHARQLAIQAGGKRAWRAVAQRDMGVIVVQPAILLQHVGILQAAGRIDRDDLESAQLRQGLELAIGHQRPTVIQDDDLALEAEAEILGRFRRGGGRERRRGDGGVSQGERGGVVFKPRLAFRCECQRGGCLAVAIALPDRAQRVRQVAGILLALANR